MVCVKVKGQLESVPSSHLHAGSEDQTQATFNNRTFPKFLFSFGVSHVTQTVLELTL